jgi:hypothetical protein
LANCTMMADAAAAAWMSIRCLGGPRPVDVHALAERGEERPRPRRGSGGPACGSR